MMNTHTNAPNQQQIHRRPQSPQERATRIVEQGQRWAAYVLQRARMRPATVHRKALDSVAFSLDIGARSFAVPSKLAGTSRHQDALTHLDQLNPLRGHRLRVEEGEEEILVFFADIQLGRVQDKHTPWLRPLLSLGTTIHFLAVTGTDRAEGYYGCNIAFARPVEAITRLETMSGDGAPAPVELAEDIYLWRDKNGIAHASIEHVVKHSPTGIEFGYMGSGPADLALSILCRFTSREQAERLYQEFKCDVIANVPQEGGLIRAAFIVSWLYAHGA